MYKQRHDHFISTTSERGILFQGDYGDTGSKALQAHCMSMMDENGTMDGGLGVQAWET
jgi:hypothetical protein